MTESDSDDETRGGAVEDYIHRSHDVCEDEVERVCCPRLLEAEGVDEICTWDQAISIMGQLAEGIRR